MAVTWTETLNRSSVRRRSFAISYLNDLALLYATSNRDQRHRLPQSQSG
jgi:hypothetical protein